jgi:hypothetical protein
MSDKWHRYKGDGRTAPKSSKDVMIVRNDFGKPERIVGYWNGTQWMRDTLHGERVVTDVVYWTDLKELPEDVEDVLLEEQKALAQGGDLDYG